MIIYIAVNTENNKCYVGQTSKTLDERRRAHERDAKYRSECSAFHRAMLKYGTERFVWFEVERGDSIETLNELEEYYVGYFGTLSPGGYNLKPGGNNHTKSPETGKRISAAKTGRPNPKAVRYKHQKGRGELLAIAANQPHRREFALFNHATLQIIYFTSINEAAEHLKVNPGSVSQLLKGSMKMMKKVWSLL